MPGHSCRITNQRDDGPPSTSLPRVLTSFRSPVTCHEVGRHPSPWVSWLEWGLRSRVRHRDRVSWGGITKTEGGRDRGSCFSFHDFAAAAANGFGMRHPRRLLKPPISDIWSKGGRARIRRPAGETWITRRRRRRLPAMERIEM